jgi:hypothetical protein
MLSGSVEQQVSPLGERERRAGSDAPAPDRVGRTGPGGADLARLKLDRVFGKGLLFADEERVAAREDVADLIGHWRR